MHGRYAKLVCFLIEHIWSLCSLFGDRKRRDTGWWVNGKHKEEASSVKDWVTEGMGVSAEWPNLSLRSCVLRESTRLYWQPHSYCAPRCCSEVPREEHIQGPPCCPSKFSNGVLSAAGCVCNRGLRKGGFPLSQLIQKKEQLFMKSRKRPPLITTH